MRSVLIVADTCDWLKDHVPTLGGLEQQVWYTTKYLRQAGWHADLRNLYYEGLDESDVAPYDVVHLYNTGGPKGALIMVAKMARRLGKRAFFTPVYWPPTMLLRYMQVNKRVVDNEMVNQTVRQPLRTLIDTATAILPNARMEWQETMRDLGIEGCTKPVFVVPNAIDLEALEKFVDKPFVGKQYVLCVGRLEFRKNQANLARAIKMLAQRGRQLNLLLIGASTGDGFTEVLNKELQGVQVAWIGQQPPEVVYGAMRHALVYCQPSFYETPGLAILEAAALGKPVVSGCWGSEREYLGDGPEYCQPDDPASIAGAIERALAADPARWQALAEFVRENYHYQAVAEQLDKIYRMPMSAAGPT